MRPTTAVARLLVVILPLLAAGCGAGAGVLPAPPSASQGDAQAGPTPPAPAPSSPAPASSSPAPAPTPRPTEVPGPPVASLATAGGAPVAGELGTFAWAGLMSDAPWVVPPPAREVTGRGSFAVVFDPAIPVQRWTARWASVTEAGAGTPSDGGQGTGSGVSVAAPTTAGTWGLQVHAWFGPGRDGTWYWRVGVRP